MKKLFAAAFFAFCSMTASASDFSDLTSLRDTRSASAQTMEKNMAIIKAAVNGAGSMPQNSLMGKGAIDSVMSLAKQLGTNKPVATKEDVLAMDNQKLVRTYLDTVVKASGPSALKPIFLNVNIADPSMEQKLAQSIRLALLSGKFDISDIVR